MTISQRNNILKIKCFTKNYSWHLKRKSINDKNYRFYDEREWRLIPEKNKLKDAKFSIHLRDYIKDKDRFNNQIAKIRFEFSPSDISYIIVDKTIEILKLIKILRTVYSTKYKNDELDILFSKIASTEQIINDY